MTNLTTQHDRSAWFAPHILSSTAAQFYGTLALLAFGGLAAVGVDTAALKTGVDATFHLPDIVSWAFCILIAISAVTAMMWAGHSYRSASTTRQRAASFFFVLAWAFVGVAVVLMRMKALDESSGDFAFGGAPADATAAPDYSSVVLLGFLFAATGILAWFEGRHINPIAFSYIRARALRARLVELITPQRGLVNRNAEDLLRAKAALAGADESRRQAELALRQFAAELMADSRIRISQILGDPAASGMTTIEPTPHPIEARPVINKEIAQ